VTRFGNIITTRPNFNYFGHFHNYYATTRNFILLVGLILHLFSSIHKLICPISRNTHQISCILKVFYNDIVMYFNVCIKIIYNMHMYVHYSYNESQNNIWTLNFLFKSETNYFKFLKQLLGFQTWYLNLKIIISNV
jgi:hypothetical protein